MRGVVVAGRFIEVTGILAVIAQLPRLHKWQVWQYIESFIYKCKTRLAVIWQL